MTLPEAMLRRELRGSRAGVKFRRQHPVDCDVIDLFCRKAALAIGVDGRVRDGPEQAGIDRRRDAHLASCGLEVVRFAAAEVLRDAPGVAAALAARAAAPLHHPAAPGGPPPRSGEDQG